MTGEQVVKVLAIIKAAYPNFYRNTEDVKDAIALWRMMFEDDDNNKVLMAVKMHISTNKFPPTVADIREQLVNATEKTITADEAWGQLIKCISRYGQYNVEGAMESMDPKVAQLVKRLGYKELCRSENQMADRAHFVKLWDGQVKHSKQQAMLPESMQNELKIAWANNDMNAKIGYKKEDN